MFRHIIQSSRCPRSRQSLHSTLPAPFFCCSFLFVATISKLYKPSNTQLSDFPQPPSLPWKIKICVQKTSQRPPRHDKTAYLVTWRLGIVYDNIVCHNLTWFTMVNESAVTHVVFLPSPLQPWWKYILVWHSVKLRHWRVCLFVKTSDRTK